MTMAAVLRHFHLLAGATAPWAAQLHGHLQGSPVRALYVGSGINREFLARLSMEDPQLESSRQLSGYSAVGGALSAAGAEVDVLLTDLPPLRALATPADAQFRFPAWIRQELALPPPGEAHRWLLSRHLEREAARHSRRQRYEVDFVRDAPTLRRFFADFYLPYAHARFGEGAIVVDEQTFLAKARRCTLARLASADEWVAGMLLESFGSAVRFGWFGAKGSAPPPGASEVLDIACIRHAHGLGVRRILLGHSRPSLTDGVVRYKAKLGAEVRGVRYPQAVLGITVRSPRADIFDHLNRRQLFTMRRGRPDVLLAAP